MIKKIAVVGLGYVGLPLALLADRKGFEVCGIDIDKRKIDLLISGKSYVDDIRDDEIKKGSVTFTDDISKVKWTDVVIVCVPTPVDKNKMPDLVPVKNAISAIAPHIKKGTLVVIESTVNPGVCDEVVKPLLEKKSGKEVGKDIYLAHCPERINPGDPKWNVSNISRVVGANNKQELEMAVKLYEKLIDADVKPMGSIKEAEAVKIVENSFRDINIAFVNELAMSFHKLGINLENVIDGAATKPFSFMPHRPGCGVGGHCIPVDPYYLIKYARDSGFEHRFLSLARDINESMPKFTVGLLTEALNRIGLPLKDAKVTLLGLSYKENVGDDRESPAYRIKELLENEHIKLEVYDPYFPNKSTQKTLKDSISGADAVIIASSHKEFTNIGPSEYKTSRVKIVIDGRNIYKLKKDIFEDLGVIYSGIGI